MSGSVHSAGEAVRDSRVVVRQDHDVVTGLDHRRRPLPVRRPRRGHYIVAATGDSGRAVARLSLAEGVDVHVDLDLVGPRNYASRMEHVQGRLGGVEGVELYWQGWLPDGVPRGVLLICPGMAEHSGRYATVVDVLGARRLGRLRPRPPRPRALGGHAGARAPVRRFLADFDTFRRRVVARHPGLRPFLLGHSMGGQIALAYALDHQDDLAGLVLSAPALEAPPVPRAVQVVPGSARVGDCRRCAGPSSTLRRSAGTRRRHRLPDDALVYQGHPTIALSLALAEQMTLLPTGARPVVAAAGAARHRRPDLCSRRSRHWRRPWARTT